MVLLDLRKAFDLVNHTVLLEKLAIYGCSEQAYAMVLSEHQQIVQFKDILSNPPKVSIPGPLFFIVFMNDMPLNTTTNVTVDMYADDSTVTATGKSIQLVKQSLNNDLQEISNWCDENRMVINVEKTKIMIITTRQKWLYLDTTDPDVWIKGDQLQVVESEKLLGLKIDHFLTWKPHIQNIHRTIAGYLALLCRIKKYHPFQTRKTFYNCYILPHINYCSTIWGIAPSSERVLKLRVILLTCKLVYKSVKGLATQYMCEMFQPVSSVSNRSTRSHAKGDLYIPQA